VAARRRAGGSAAAPAATPGGELRIGTGLSIPTALDVTQGSVGYNMITYGAGETLMRITPEQQLEPWLAETITRVDPNTWQVTLRQNVRFHDGSPLTAEAVAESIRSSLTTLAGAKNFLPTETEISVTDAQTLTLRTPEPAGNLPYSLANWNFVIHRPAQNGVSPLTGMYRPVRLEKDQEFVLEPFADHWGGPPPLAQVVVRRITDGNARALALQSGDLDMLTNVPPNIAASLPADVTQTSVPGTRLHYVILNNTRAPFDDVRVRTAAAHAIDREALLAATLEGQGSVATNMYPSSVGISIVPAQETNIEQAKQLLDEAGWVAGADGVRTKDGQRLEFLLYSYPGRPEITALAITMQAQLAAIGVAVKVEEVQDITSQIEGGEFQASMFSVRVASDPQYMPGVSLVSGAAYNYGGYQSAALEAVFAQLRATSELDERQSLARQMQEIVAQDTPNIYLVAPPLITAFNSAVVSGYTPHPDDLYLVTRELTVTR
jgi:peptide/nickel transport system substrate-binding protein